MRLPGTASLLLALAVLGCHHHDRGAGPAEVHGRETGAQEAAPISPAPNVAEPSRPRAIVVVSDPAVVDQLRAPLDFSRLLVGTEHASTRALWRHRRYSSIIESEHGVGYYRKDNGPTFPRWWMRNSRTFFELVGVANRLDRKDVRPGTCGETRLLYRLAYRAPDDTMRRLPVAFNVVFEQVDDGRGCRDAARRWLIDESADVATALTAEDGPLHPSRLVLDRLLAIEINARQEPNTTQNFASTGLLNRLAALPYDHERGVFVEAPLELQPDETIYHKAFTPRRALQAFLTDPKTMESTMLGVAAFPAPTSSGYVPLAKRLSVARWTVFGLEGAYLQPYVAPALDERGGGDERVGPFTAIFRPDAFADAVRADDPLLATPSALLHRLDGQSCSGCHRQRSIAGFHFPGAGGDGELRDGMSPHLRAQLEWREAYVAAVAAGEPPTMRRPLHNEGPAGFGAHCSTETSPVAGLECAPDFSCRAVAGFAFGTCLPSEYAGPEPCTTTGPDDGTCLGPPPVFPGGFRATPCPGKGPCASIPTVADLDACRRDDDPWQCAGKRAASLVVDACTTSSDCRDGYACVGETNAVCMPAMLLPEYRLIGHAFRAG